MMGFQGGASIMRNAFLLAAAIVLFGASARTSTGDVGGDFDWSRFAEEETVTVVTTNDDGSERETTVWLVVVDGDAFIRTGNTRWGGNVEKRPEIALRIEAETIPVAIHFITDAEQRRRVTEAFRGKYGFFDRILSPFRGSSPKIMHLARRDGG
jgi:hypothetical protein